MSAPEVSVVLPTRDRSERLALALRSALRQREVELEIIVVDDASTDGTSVLLGGVDDPRVRSVRNDVSTGVSAARNRGVALARAAWVAFLDDDDLWAPDKLHRQLEALRATGRRWAYGGEVIVDRRLRVLDGSPPPPPDEVVASLERHDAVPGGSSSVMVAAELLDRVGPFDPRLATSEDWDMWIRLAREGPPACVAEPVVALSVHRGRSTAMPRMLAELDVVARRHDIPVDWARHYRWAAWEALRDRRRLQAVGYYVAAIRRGDVGSIPRAAIALAWPGMLERRHRSGGAAERWKEEAAAWIEELTSRPRGGRRCG